MKNPIEITSKSGLRFRLHPLLGMSVSDFRYNAEKNQMEAVPHPSDIADVDPDRAVALAKELGYTQDGDGVWCDPMLSFGAP